MQATEPPVPSPDTADKTANPLNEQREGGRLVQPLLQLLHKTTPERVFAWNASDRFTFRDIVRYYPRSNGKFGFTVWELCTTMLISAVPLTEARDNPGRLSLNAVVALSEATGESILSVIADLLAEARGKKEGCLTILMEKLGLRLFSEIIHLSSS